MDTGNRKPITTQMVAAVIAHLAILQHKVMAGHETYDEAAEDLGADVDIEQVPVLARTACEILEISVDGPDVSPSTFSVLFRLLYDGIERSPDNTEKHEMARSYAELTSSRFGAISWWLGELTYVIEEELAEGNTVDSCREICLDVRVGLHTWGTAPGLSFVEWTEVQDVGHLVRTGAISAEAARIRLLAHAEVMQMQKVSKPPPIKGELIFNPLIDDSP